ncbi:MAG: hypothetical protein SWH78_15730 [Thermodesulfobacteriota bacterium]|nr:hypothetical protein [Thermodesulfobacteriota bacterium]
MRMRIILCLCLLTSLCIACDGGSHGDSNVTPSIVGGACYYVDIPGIARIVSITTPASNDNNCNNAVEVTFDFTPDDPAAADTYLFPNWSDTGQHLTVGDGKNPPKEWVLAQGLTPSSKHRCVRSEITDGACTPVVFSFPDIDFSRWPEFCFGS